MEPHARYLTYITKKNIELVNWGGTDMDVHQILYNYDQQGKKTEGLFVTNFDLRAHEKRKRASRYQGNLYIRARTSTLGLWEVTMKDVRIKELGRQCFWFVYDQAASHRILEKPQK
jgi:hypothetical protein